MRHGGNLSRAAKKQYLNEPTCNFFRRIRSEITDVCNELYKLCACVYSCRFSVIGVICKLRIIVHNAVCSRCCEILIGSRGETTAEVPKMWVAESFFNRQ